MVYRDGDRTLVWDDKLADSVAIDADTQVPIEQCLTFDHAQFEDIQEAIRAGTPIRRFLNIVRRDDGLYEFSAAPECAPSAGRTTLYFDHGEFAAFVQAVRGHEFEHSAFLFGAL
ncbi:hypothetical protein HLB23_15575 [Nocardia uniformis]|uniref:Uncharacterized protein n=1 Tax=Nocardia uniformis TaxID=53432 RepID=A0A849BYA8_9NOCA|nr:hypothetical protein [Nocardia uniformis]NNH71264.1 hypothetical protein [Nocardia uniformis]